MDWITALRSASIRTLVEQKHLREAWRELMFADCDQEAKASRDPVAPAQRSEAAMKKACSHTLDDGSPVHSWHSLMAELSTIVRNTAGITGWYRSR